MFIADEGDSVVGAIHVCEAYLFGFERGVRAARPFASLVGDREYVSDCGFIQDDYLGIDWGIFLV